MFGVKMGGRWHNPTLASGSLRRELLAAHLLAGRTNQTAGVKPLAVHKLHLYFLSGVETGEGMVEHLHVEALLLTNIVVTP